MSDIVQRSPEWFASKLGRVGASRVSEIMATTKSGPSASRKNYMAELLCERLTGKYAEDYQSPAMLWGIENEPLARAAYEMETGNSVTECGGFPHPTIPMAGASPDGLIGDSGVLEIKCPNTATHLSTLDSRTIDLKYRYQITWQVRCSGREWGDFVSFDPRLPGKLSICIIHFDPPKEMMDDCEREVRAFVEELDALEKRMRERMGE